MKEQGQLEAYWAQHKYSIMERDYANYKAMSMAFHQKLEKEAVYKKIQDYMAEPVTHKGAYNTFLHVWGYVKQQATEAEKTQFFSLLDAYKASETHYYKTKAYLGKLVRQYGVAYLQKGVYFGNVYEVEERDFAPALVTWYEANKRDLPWRLTKDPYHIWLSEIMCQQTQVATVIPYYERFVSQWSDFHALGAADEDAVLKAWEGLGYYGRARRLMALAKIVSQDYDGVMPKDKKTLLKLPGIGPYTVGAILSIVYDQKIPAVDGNVLRVISRTHQVLDNIADPKTKKTFEAIVLRLIPDQAGAFNQGLMELGARICTPTNPKCEDCPLASMCVARLIGSQAILPIKSKAKKKKVEQIAVGLVTCKGHLLIEKATHTGLLGGLWGLPFAGDEMALKDQLLDNYGLGGLVLSKPVFHKKHVFTHKVWEMTYYEISLDDIPQVDYPLNAWLDFKAIYTYPISTAFLKGIKAYLSDK